MRRVFLVLAVIALLTLSAMPPWQIIEVRKAGGTITTPGGTTTIRIAIGTQAGHGAAGGNGTIGAIALGGAGTSSGRN